MTKDTVCKKCAFAEYTGFTQTGCRVDMLKKFADDGVNILECYDEDREFYVLQNRQCMFQRHVSWLPKNNEPLDWEYQKDRATKEVSMKYHMFIKANDSLDDCKKSIDSLMNQELPPDKITVIRQTTNLIRPTKIIPLLQNTGKKWRLENLTYVMPWEKAMSLVLDHDKSHYFGMMNAGFEFPSKTFSYINEQIIVNLFRFSMLTPDENDNGLFMLFNVYKHWKIMGEPDKTLEENIKESECQETTKSYYPMTDFLR